MTAALNRYKLDVAKRRIEAAMLDLAAMDGTAVAEPIGQLKKAHAQVLKLMEKPVAATTADPKKAAREKERSEKLANLLK